MQLVGLDHIQLAMPAGGEPAARAFYVELLGLSEAAKPAVLAGRGGCWFAGPGIGVHLGVEQEFAPARKAHPAFSVADLEALRGTLAAAGVPITLDDTLPNVRRFYATDPFGNRIEFIQAGDRMPVATEVAGETQGALADSLGGFIGALHSGEYVPGGARMSEDTGDTFTEALVEKRQQGRA